jgi:hypothetical protein
MAIYHDAPAALPAPPPLCTLSDAPDSLPTCDRSEIRLSRSGFRICRFRLCCVRQSEMATGLRDRMSQWPATHQAAQQSNLPVSLREV